jgi:hypothetical protein
MIDAIHKGVRQVIEKTREELNTQAAEFQVTMEKHILQELREKARLLDTSLNGTLNAH